VSAATDVGKALAGVREQLAALAASAGRDPRAVQLVAVSKTHPAEAIRTAHAAGQRDFGENRVQELRAKAEALKDLPGLRWHWIGSLQTNKVRELLSVPGLVLLHSLDRPKLADELQRELARTGSTLDVLLQLHATDEPTKHGCPPVDAPVLVQHVLAHCPSLRLRGLMAMGPLHGDPVPAFRTTAALRDRLQAEFSLDLSVLSMGMSGDLAPAVAAGSTLVRIGTAIFGARPEP